MAQTTRRHRLRPGYGYEAGERITRTARGAYKIRGGVRTLLIDALAGGATVEEACKIAGVGRTAFYRAREQSSRLERDCVAAISMGFVIQKLPLERRKRFLFMCSWFGVIDLAREFCGMHRRDLARVFKLDPEFKDEVMDECKRSTKFGGTDGTRQDFSFVAMSDRLLPVLAAMDEFD